MKSQTSIKNQDILVVALENRDFKIKEKRKQKNNKVLVTILVLGWKTG